MVAYCEGEESGFVKINRDNSVFLMIFMYSLMNWERNSWFEWLPWRCLIYIKVKTN